MAKANKQIIIDAIIKLIESGKGYNKVLEVNGEKWKLPPSTFNRYWKKASEQHTDKQQAIKKELLTVDIAGAIDARRMGLKSKEQRLMYLQKLVEDSERDLEEVDRAESRIYARKAIKDIQAEISKIEGEYAPTKQAQTDKDGNDVKPFTPEDVTKIITHLRNVASPAV